MIVWFWLVVDWLRCMIDWLRCMIDWLRFMIVWFWLMIVWFRCMIVDSMGITRDWYMYLGLTTRVWCLTFVTFWWPMVNCDSRMTDSIARRRIRIFTLSVDFSTIDRISFDRNPVNVS
jgi:hypothetical protein